MIDTPELDKLSAISEQGDNQTIGAFLEWAESNDYQLCKEVTTKDTDFWGNETSDAAFVPTDMEHVLAEYFGIDLAKAEQEQRALLKTYATSNEKHEDTYTVHPAPEGA